jgi:hypothetical protein
MSDLLRIAEDKLIAALANSARGPKRNGLFALWLVVRACDGLLPPDVLTPRAHRRRLEGLERRLSSLSLHPALRRLLQGCVRDLQPGHPEAAVTVLRRLATSVPEPLCSEAGEALTEALRAAGAVAAPAVTGPARDR